MPLLAWGGAKGAHSEECIPYSVDLYYLGSRRKEAQFQQGTANELRHSVGSRLWGTAGPWEYNFEAVYQWGEFGDGNIRAWTIASDTGYHLRSLGPRVDELV